MGDAFDRVAKCSARSRTSGRSARRRRCSGARRADAVDRRVAQVDVAAGHVDLRAQRARAVGEFAGAHAPEQVEVLVDAAIAERRVAAGLGQRAAVFAHLVGAQVADDRPCRRGSASQRAAVEHLEVVRGVAQFGPFEAQPAHVVLDRLDVLEVFLGRDWCRRSAGCSVPPNSLAMPKFRQIALGVADVQVAVGLRRKPGARPGACLPLARSSRTIWRMKSCFSAAVVAVASFMRRWCGRSGWSTSLTEWPLPLLLASRFPARHMPER